MKKKAYKKQPILETLEPRLLFSAGLEGLLAPELLPPTAAAISSTFLEDLATEAPADDTAQSDAVFRKELESQAGSIEASTTLSGQIRKDNSSILESTNISEADYLSTPLAFEQNAGQTGQVVDFLARGSGQKGRCAAQAARSEDATLEPGDLHGRQDRRRGADLKGDAGPGLVAIFGSRSEARGRGRGGGG